jgi:predicted ATPase/class 3 adenylate cyclase
MSHLNAVFRAGSSSEAPRRDSAVERALDGGSFSAIPTGIVTFLFSDIEGSTVRWEREAALMRDAVRRHDAIMRLAIANARGHIFKTIGDAFCVAFHAPADAVAAAIEAQCMLAAADFTAVDGIRVRIAIHLGASDERDGDYYGQALNRVARLVSIGHGGQVLCSAASAGIARDALPSGYGFEDLGEHRLKDLTLPEHVFQVTGPGLDASFPALRSLSVQRNNLPHGIGPLLGRDAFVQDLVATLAERRLVSLVGPGGIGKTRLALQAAAERLDAMSDGAWFVDLAPIASGAYVADRIATDLEIATVAGRGAAETIVAWMKGKRLLIVLDNCEHVISDVASIVATIARVAPDVTILATTREPLGISGEFVLRVPPHDVPPRAAILAQDAMLYGAVALFVARAQAADARFVLTDATAPAVADIVRRLDGIALAIELAAARVKVLSVPNIAARLDERFRILTGGSRTALPRQRTMRALIDWSWDLLDERERSVMRSVAIFSGGWTAEAAESVCANEDVDTFEVLDLLASLVDKSLVTSDINAGSVRNGLLETTRAYAVERLDESGERDALAMRHALWAEAFCDRMHETYDGTPAWLQTMEAELDNIRAALAWTLDHGYGALAARIALRGVCGYWWFRTPAEGLSWLERIGAKLDRNADALLYAGILTIEGSLSRGRRSAEIYDEAVAILKPLHDRGIEFGKYANYFKALAGVANCNLYAGRFSQAREAFEYILADLRERKRERTTLFATYLVNYATAVAHCGDIDRSRALFAQAEASFAALNEAPGVRNAAVARGLVEYDAGDFEAARELFVRAETIDSSLSLSVGAAEDAAYLAALAVLDGMDVDARRRIREVLELALAGGIEPPAEVLLAAALLASRRGDAPRGSRILEFVEARAAARGYPLDYIARDLRDRVHATVSSAAPATASARDLDRAAAVDDAMTEALTEAGIAS